jgi:hypothetical protein
MKLRVMLILSLLTVPAQLYGQEVERGRATKASSEETGPSTMQCEKSAAPIKINRKKFVPIYYTVVAGSVPFGPPALVAMGVRSFVRKTYHFLFKKRS